MMERGESAVVPRLGPVTVVRDGHAMEIPSDRSVNRFVRVCAMRCVIRPFRVCLAARSIDTSLSVRAHTGSWSAI